MRQISVQSQLWFGSNRHRRASTRHKKHCYKRGNISNNFSVYLLSTTTQSEGLKSAQCGPVIASLNILATEYLVHTPMLRVWSGSFTVDLNYIPPGSFKFNKWIAWVHWRNSSCHPIQCIVHPWRHASPWMPLPWCPSVPFVMECLSCILQWHHFLMISTLLRTVYSTYIFQNIQIFFFFQMLTNIFIKVT